MGIDVGVDNLMACALYDEGSFVIDGKRLKSDLLWLGKKMDYLSSRRQDRRYTKRMQRLSGHITCMTDDHIYKAVARMLDEAKRHGVTTIVIGKNDGLKMGGIKNDNLKKKDRRKVNRTFVRVPMMSMIARIIYKAREYGIRALTVNESYTSLASFYDGDVPEIG